MQDKRKACHPEAPGKALRFLYGTFPGRLILKLLVCPFVSKIAGAFLSSPLSTGMIGPFVKKHRICMARYEQVRYRSYNDFFTRKLKADRFSFDSAQDSLISPCDAKLSVYNITENMEFWIKGVPYSLADLLQNRKLAEIYKEGLCLIFRLTVDDYHRYCYIDDGTKEKNIFIPGKLHTVQPIAFERNNVYRENCREYTVMQTEHFGRAVQMEVGALLVGKIVNFQGKGAFLRGQEKGMFQFGGSTVVLLLEEDRAELDREFFENTEKGLETAVRIGERIGRIKFPKKN